MKKILALLLVIGITTGCTLAPTYDSQETWMFAEFTTHAKFLHQEDCTKGSAAVNDRLEKMNWTIQLLDTHADHAPKHDEIKRITKILVDDIKEFRSSYNEEGQNPVYCRFKAEAIIIKSNRTIQALENLQR